MAPRTLSAALLSLPLLVVAATAGVVAQPLRPLVEGTVPLILKDGRIAEVSIFAVPFVTASSEMPAGVEDQLRELIGGYANDCFLTAQVIGHVEPGPDKDGGTLAAHRLARARAERVQELMTAQGLPAKSIASVWDWQFSTPESRATVWFFALDPEEGCTGEPLLAASGSSETPKMNEAEAPPAATTAEAAAGTGDGQPTAVAGEPRAPEPEAAEKPAATEPVPLTVTVPRPEEAADRLPGASPPEPPPAAGEAPAVAGGEEEPPPEKLRAATEPGEVRQQPVALAATVPETPAPAPAEVAADAPSERPAGGGPELEIVFDLNSSWLPHGAVKELRGLLERLREGRYAVEIVAAVDNGPIKNGTPEDARRYNRWLAERRANRVAEWLRRRGDGTIAAIEQRFREDDPSRKVVIRARPLP